jgi:hypothetical protein
MALLQHTISQSPIQGIVPTQIKLAKIIPILYIARRLFSAVGEKKKICKTAVSQQPTSIYKIFSYLCKIV